MKSFFHLPFLLAFFLFAFLSFQNAWADGEANANPRQNSENGSQDLTYNPDPDASWECRGTVDDTDKAEYQGFGSAFQLKCKQSMSFIATLNFECICVDPAKCGNRRVSKTISMPCPINEDTAVCGNGIPENKEACDDGNLVSGDGCSDQCKLEVCGDRSVQEKKGEQCDDGNKNDGDGCSSSCKLEACGDRVKQASEECDDGNTISGDGCSDLCRAEICGDGIKHTSLSEECDDGNTRNNDGCSSTCRLEKCGDGAVQIVLNEQCDDGNTRSEDGCSSTCLTESCGDRVVQQGLQEQCDDGNNINGDGCSASCLIETSRPLRECVRQKVACVQNVSTGKHFEWVLCEDDNSVISGPGKSCDADCEGEKARTNSNCVQPVCGNATTEPGEECDAGEDNSDAGACTTACKLPVCGDTFTQSAAGEQCDDGNTSSGDGCSETCQQEQCDASCSVSSSKGAETILSCSTSSGGDEVRWTFNGVSNVENVEVTDGAGLDASAKVSCGGLIQSSTGEVASVNVTRTSGTRSCSITKEVVCS